MTTSELTCGFPSEGPAGFAIVAVSLTGAEAEGAGAAVLAGGLAGGTLTVAVSGLLSGLVSTLALATG